MRNIAIVALFLSVAAVTTAQVTVTGSFPANSATGVSTNTTISIAFSAPIDTTYSFGPGETLLTNVDSVTGTYWSADKRTFYANAVLQPGTVYFVMVFTIHPAGGGFLQTPYLAYFTTAPSFPSNLFTVSGTITSGTTGIPPAGAIIGLMATPFTGGNPEVLAGAVADGSGNFVIPHVPAGKWYIIAAKDANGDGDIDPSKGDGIGVGDSVTVTTSNVSGLVVPLQTVQAPKYMDIRDPVLALAGQSLPSNRELRAVFAWDMDSLSRSRDWQFVYTVPGSPGFTTFRADPFGVNPDPGQNWDWLGTPRPITNLLSAALPDSVIARAERQGGAAYRLDPPPNPQAQFRIYLRGGDLSQSEFGWFVPDQSKNYWGVGYQWQIQVTQDSSHSIKQRLFLADFLTGQILGVTGAEENPSKEVPGSYSLGQNYPNPFNPSTSINFGLPVRSHARLDVYNLIGQRVASLVDEVRNAGTYEVRWTPSLPSGVYLYRLEAVGSEGQNFLQVRKMVYVK